jgi:cyclic pyranopterin phosphate synthase
MQNAMPDKLTDRFGRKVTYLRISITDRCNFRCVYCMPAEGIPHAPRKEVLSYEEICELVEVFAAEGVTRVRITGGEPLIRADVPELVSTLKAIDGIDKVAMTTNAFLLRRHAQKLRDAGLDSLNISLDTLDPDRFKEITRVGSLERVLDGIEAAREAQFSPIKLNAVIVGGFNDDEMPDLVRFAVERDLIMRFIEFMPIGSTVWGRDENGDPRGDCVPAKTMREVIGQHWRLEADDTTYGKGPASYWKLHGPHTPAKGAPFGIIAAVTECFCEACNRVRLTSQGGLRACLADDHEVDLRAPLRGVDDHEERRLAIEDLIRVSLYGKKERHDFDIDGGSVTTKQMTAIGG